MNDDVETVEVPDMRPPEGMQLVGFRMPYMPDMTVYDWDSKDVRFWMPRAIMLLQAGMLLCDNEIVDAVSQWLATEESKRTDQALNDLKDIETATVEIFGKLLMVSFGKAWQDISVDNGKECIRMEFDPSAEKASMTFTKEDFK